MKAKLLPDAHRVVEGWQIISSVRDDEEVPPYIRLFLRKEDALKEIKKMAKWRGAYVIPCVFVPQE